MTFEKLNFLNGQSLLAGLVLYHSWIVTIQKNNNLDCGLSSVGFYIKKLIFFILIK